MYLVALVPPPPPTTVSCVKSRGAPGLHTRTHTHFPQATMMRSVAAAAAAAAAAAGRGCWRSSLLVANSAAAAAAAPQQPCAQRLQQLLHHHHHHHHHHHQHGWRSLSSSSSSSNSSSAGGGGGAPRPGLSSILKIDLVAHATPDEVEDIWLKRHSQEEEGGSTTHVASVWSREEAQLLGARARASPAFVLPLKKGGGFATYFLQWLGAGGGGGGGGGSGAAPPRQLLVTSLEEYKAHGAAAQPLLAADVYAELAPSHGLVLVRGELLRPGALTPAEARTCLELARAFYVDAQAFRFVASFNHTPDDFDFDELLRLLGIGGGSGGGGGGDRRAAAAAATAGQAPQETQQQQQQGEERRPG